ncbi:MAG: hypothetical protein D3909_07090 [Candidatus Electrothrix sp. ATG1]|nr:hypothetical protein [Candidatus Electrothrix sp. ATG1]
MFNKNTTRATIIIHLYPALLKDVSECIFSPFRPGGSKQKNKILPNNFDELPKTLSYKAL